MRKLVLFFFIGLIVTKSMAQNNKQIYNFEPDIRIFNAFAFLNACGYDHDWVKMHPMRVEIRKYVDSVLQDDFKQKINDYSKRVKLDYYYCGAYALNLDNASGFKWICDSCNLDLKNKFLGLDSLLKQFYEKAQIKALWIKHKEALDSINYPYEPFAQKAISDIISFTKINKDFYSNYSSDIHFMICPLLSHYQDFNHTVNKTLYLINGPNGAEPGPWAFYHEALHPPIGPIIDKYIGLTKNFGELNNCAQERLKGNYPDMVSLLNESFVRTIQKYLIGQYYKYDNDRTFKMVEDEYKLGFIFCLYIYENIPKYIKSKKSFDEYYPILMSNLDVDKEINRWRNYPKDEKK